MNTAPSTPGGSGEHAPERRKLDALEAISRSRTASDLAMQFPELWNCGERQGDEAYDFPPPLNDGAILTPEHPALEEILRAQTVYTFVDLLVRFHLQGLYEAQPETSFTHLTPETARMLAEKALELDIPNIVNLLTGFFPRRISDLANPAPPRIYPNCKLATIPVIGQGTPFMVTDPRRGAAEFAPHRDPLAPICFDMYMQDGSPWTNRARILPLFER